MVTFKRNKKCTKKILMVSTATDKNESMNE